MIQNNEIIKRKTLSYSLQIKMKQSSLEFSYRINTTKKETPLSNLQLKLTDTNF